MKTALDVQREMNHYQPRYQNKNIRQKLDAREFPMDVVFK